MTDPRSDVEVALAAAAAGAAVVRAAYGGALTRHAKTATDFVTDADLDAERAILDVITAARPADGVLGEETGAHEASGSRRWLVDPLCGTLNFAARTPLVAVNVALVDGDHTFAAVTADPLAGELFWTDATGAWVREGGVDLPLAPTAVSRLVEVNCDGPLDRPFVGGALVADPALRSAFGPRVISSTLAVAWVAAGCVVTDLAGGPLHADRGLIAAADEETHERLVGIVAPHLAAVR